MEENLQEQSSSCPVESKKCCTKGIVIVVVCSLICFFLGYYFGNKSNTNINRVVGSGISRPFNTNNLPRRIPNRPPNIPQRIPNTPRVQRPPIQRPNIPPQIQNMNTNTQSTQNNAATQKSTQQKK